MSYCGGSGRSSLLTNRRERQSKISEMRSEAERPEVHSEEYTKKVGKLVDDAISNMKEASLLMKKQGDEARSMDLDEAIGYAEASIEITD